jgi:hypothetical protein
MHVDQVMANVPESDRCAGHAHDAASTESSKGMFSFLSRR